MTGVEPWTEPHPDACPRGEGNRTGYSRGCRCAWCRWSNAAYMAHYRGQPDLPARPDPPVQLHLDLEEGQR